MSSFEGKSRPSTPSQKELSRQPSQDDPRKNTGHIAAYAPPSSFLSVSEQRLQRSREFPVAQRVQQRQQQTGTYSTRYFEGHNGDLPTVFGSRLRLGIHPSWDFLPPESRQRTSPEQILIREPPIFNPLTSGVPPGPPGYKRDIERLPTDEFGAVGDPPQSGSVARAVHPAGDGSLSSMPPLRSEPASPSSLDVSSEPPTPRAAETSRGTGRYRSQRRASNRDEFDGPVQLLERPTLGDVDALESDLPQLRTNLNAQEQAKILHDVNERLSQCAFNFVAKYQFPVPIEPDKKQVTNSADRDWTEWAYLLKRLAMKRRIPARVLYNGQIKQFVAVLENSLEVRHTRDQRRPLKDDRNILQIISAATQVAKIAKDAPVMEHFDQLYERVESLILNRQGKQQLRN